MKLANTRNIPVAAVSKEELNKISDNRPHQNVALSALPLIIDDVSELGAAEINVMLLPATFINKATARG